MKTILIVVLLACAFSGGACSRSDKKPDAAVQTTPNSSLKADAERLQQATAKDDRAAIRAVLKDAVPEFGSRSVK